MPCWSCRAARDSGRPFVSGRSLCRAPDLPRRMLFHHFPVALACSGGDRRRGRGQTALLTLGASVTALLFVR